MQCKDIPDLPILRFLSAWHGERCFTFEKGRCDRSVFHAMPEGVPWKLGLAKMAGLIRRGLVSGCACGCRGDFELTDEGRAYLEEDASKNQSIKMIL